MKTFYPTSLLITGFDILFFWVARMIMMGLEFMGDVPFHKVYIHGLVRDAERNKMSKMRGNTIDPLVVTEKYGTDAIRMALLMGAAPGTDIILSEDRMESTRAFANKIWNAARLIEMNRGREEAASGMPVEDRWIFSRLNSCAERANAAIERFRYHELAQDLWQFFWHEFCDWYLELKKVSGDWRNVPEALETALRLLHPAMPFLTEELWQRLEVENGPISIALAAYPQYDPAKADSAAEREIEALQNIVTLARTLRAEMKIDPKTQLDGVLYSRSDALEIGKRHAEAILKLANVRLEFRAGNAPQSPAMLSTAGLDLVLNIPQSQMEAQRKRLHKEREQLERNIANSNRQLEDEVFLSKAPANVVTTIRRKLAEYETQLHKVRAALNGSPE